MTDSLKHIGVLGMKWGKRNSKSGVTKKSSKGKASLKTVSKNGKKSTDFVKKNKKRKVNTLQEPRLSGTAILTRLSLANTSMAVFNSSMFGGS